MQKRYINGGGEEEVKRIIAQIIENNLIFNTPLTYSSHRLVGSIRIARIVVEVKKKFQKKVSETKTS